MDVKQAILVVDKVHSGAGEDIQLSKKFEIIEWKKFKDSFDSNCLNIFQVKEIFCF